MIFGRAIAIDDNRGPGKEQLDVSDGVGAQVDLTATWYNSSMEVTRRVSAIDPKDLPALERILGMKLAEHENALLVVKAIELSSEAVAAPQSGTELPPWCRVYDGLPDEEIDEIERGIVRLDLGRAG